MLDIRYLGIVYAMAHDKTVRLKQQIIESTDDLLYHKGFNLMSFSDIAEASGVPRGNINYHFKTKNDILAAVIEYRIEQMNQMLDTWNDEIKSPLERLKRYSNIPAVELNNVVRYGCPMGSLNTELGKSQGMLQSISRGQYDAFLAWIKKQFKQLVPEQNANHLAMHLLVMTQGLAVMSQSYEDRSLVRREIKIIEAWLDALVK